MQKNNTRASQKNNDGHKRLKDLVDLVWGKIAYWFDRWIKWSSQTMYSIDRKGRLIHKRKYNTHWVQVFMDNVFPLLVWGYIYFSISIVITGFSLAKIIDYHADCTNFTGPVISIKNVLNFHVHNGEQMHILENLVIYSVLLGAELLLPAIMYFMNKKVEAISGIDSTLFLIKSIIVMLGIPLAFAMYSVITDSKIFATTQGFWKFFIITTLFFSFLLGSVSWFLNKVYHWLHNSDGELNLAKIVNADDKMTFFAD